jgi:hypothetical protein
MIEDHEGGSSQKHRRLTTVGWCIIVMGISLGLVVILWLGIGHIGPIIFCKLANKATRKIETSIWSSS